MVTGEGRLKVLDFGLAKLSEGVPAGEAASPPHATTTEPGRILGTLYYMSPEQAEGLPVDHRSDVFSLGVVLYEMATGARPFEGDTPASILSAVLKDTPPPVTERKPALPRDLGRIVRRCLHKDPERRYQAAKDLRNDLEELKKEVDSGDLQLPVVGRPRRRLVSIAMAVGLGVLALGIATYLLFFREGGAEEAWEIKPLTSFRGAELSPTLSPDGSLVAYEKSGPGGMDIYVMALAGGDPLKLTQSPPDNRQPCWSPNGDLIAFASEQGADRTICVIPPLGGPVREIVRVSKSSGWLALGAMPWSPDGKQLLFRRDRAIWKVDVRTREETRLTEPDVSGGEATWSRNGERIAFTRWRDGRPGLWLLPATGGEPQPLLVDDYDNYSPAWSTDSRRIVFVRSGHGSLSRNLWEIDVDSGRLRQLTVGPTENMSPTVARDGRIAFSQGAEESDVYICRVAEASHRQVTFHTGGSYAARFSPDGKSLAYATGRSGSFEIWLLDLATGSPRQLTFDRLGWGYFDWSPDGRQIVIASDRDGDPRLWLLNLDGKPPHLLMDRPVSHLFSRWSPDGQAISFYHENEVWAVDPNGGNPRLLLLGVVSTAAGEGQFDWYQGSRHAVFTRRAGDNSGGLELAARDLESGREVVLFCGDVKEMVVSPDGRAVAFCQGGDNDQELFVLHLRPPDSPGGLPERIGEAQKLTDGKGLWHVHHAGWSPDGKEIAYTRATLESDIFVIENYR
jgi:Tol biopolymer transport system component